MNIEEIKKYLLSLNLVYNNEYLDLYFQVIKNNIETKWEKYKTQKHHIIPLFVYKKIYSLNKREEAENKKYTNWSVTMSYKEHLLCHYYLCLCAKHNWFLYGNYKALSYILENKTFKTNDLQEELKSNLYDFINNLDYYSQIKEKANIIQAEKSSKSKKGKKRTEEQKQRIKLAVRKERNERGKTVRVFKGDSEKLVPIKDLDTYIENGWLRGRTEKCKKLISEDHKGKHFSPQTEWKKGQISPRAGHSPTLETRHKMSLAKLGNKNRLGKKFTEEQRKKLSEAHKGLGGKKIIQCDLKGKELQKWNSIKEAAEYLGVDGNYISSCCNGHKKTYLKYTWKFYIPEGNEVVDKENNYNARYESSISKGEEVF